jgi:hypothetical protein
MYVVIAPDGSRSMAVYFDGIPAQVAIMRAKFRNAKVKIEQC